MDRMKHHYEYLGQIIAVLNTSADLRFLLNHIKFEYKGLIRKSDTSLYKREAWN